MNKATLCGVSAALALASLLSLSACSEKAGRDSSGPDGTNAAMLIEPNLTVGKIHAGMTKEQVIAELGQPGRQTANALEYPRLGLAVMPSPDGVVHVVMCGDVTGLNGPFVKAFTGRTKEGVGMTSSRDEVLKAYGEPTGDEKMRFGLESMNYPSLGFTFTLEAGKVHHIIVRLRAPEPDRTVTIEAAPTK
ncbi:MAG TPA: hypothetical protein VNZ64_06105 [Candidatus Acidoferrum sp.]|jgi:hypothetical protein|nr:hypothetical protein [Candidatus Acidoferrum sp.]